MYTLDNTNELIIWDIRYFTALQIIPSPNQKEKTCHGILVINASLLWVYGSRFITYDQQVTFNDHDVDIPDESDVKTVTNAFHNQFFSTICV